MKVQKTKDGFNIAGYIPDWLLEVILRIVWFLIGGEYYNDKGVKPMTFEAYKAMVKKDGKII